MPATPHTAANAKSTHVSYTDLCDTEHGPAVEPRTYVTVSWDNPVHGDDFISTSYDGHVDYDAAVARAVEDFNTPHVPCTGCDERDCADCAEAREAASLGGYDERGPVGDPNSGTDCTPVHYVGSLDASGPFAVWYVMRSGRTLATCAREDDAADLVRAMNAPVLA